MASFTILSIATISLLKKEGGMLRRNFIRFCALPQSVFRFCVTLAA
jgi:hypothetical protein